MFGGVCLKNKIVQKFHALQRLNKTPQTQTIQIPENYY